MKHLINLLFFGTLLCLNPAHLWAETERSDRTLGPYFLIRDSSVEVQKFPLLSTNAEVEIAGRGGGSGGGPSSYSMAAGAGGSGGGGGPSGSFASAEYEDTIKLASGGNFLRLISGAFGVLFVVATFAAGLLFCLFAYMMRGKKLWWTAFVCFFLAFGMLGFRGAVDLLFGTDFVDYSS